MNVFRYLHYLIWSAYSFDGWNFFSTVTESGGPYFEGEKYWKRKDTGQIKQLPKRSKSSCFQISPIFSPIVPHFPTSSNREVRQNFPIPVIFLQSMSPTV